MSNISNIVVDETLPAEDSLLQQGSTTNFVSDTANASVATVTHPNNIGKMFSPNLSVFPEQNIKDFLRKPVSLFTGSFTTADSGILVNNNAYNVLMAKSIYQQKVSGHLAYKAKLVVRIVVNANRFQQGRYFLAFFPTCGSLILGNQYLAWYNQHVATLCQRTQLPKVEIDLNRDSEAVLEIPWISSFGYAPVKTSYINNYGVPGVILLCCYSPLVAPTGSTTATYSVFAHFEDLELHAPATPQSRANFKSSKKRIAGSDVETIEQRQAGLAPISSALSHISKAMDSVAHVPMLSSIAGPVGWFTDLASGVASAFGWSSPLDLSEVTRAVQTIVPFANNCDMPNGAMPMSLFARNKLELLPGIAATDIDETSVDHVKTIPAYFTSFNLSTSDVAYTSLFSQNIGYTQFFQSIVDNGRTIYAYAPVSYLALFFGLARGGLIFRFKIVSTEFHSGRYAIVFCPIEAQTGSTSTANTLDDYTMREIIDLRTGCEFTFHVPYTSISNYRKVGSSLGEVFGVLKVYAINPLTAPSTVSSTCQVLVEVAAAPDVEYAFPKTNPVRLYAPAAPQSNVKFIPSANEITSGSIGNTSLNDDNHLNARHCIGEKVVSLLSLLKHNNQVMPAVAPLATAISASIAPYAIFTAAFVGATNSDSPWLSDHFSMISAMYGMSRGGVRWKVFNTNTTSVNCQELTSATIVYSTSGTGTGIDEYSTLRTSKRWSLNVVQNSIYRGGIDVQVPPYHNTFARINATELTGASTVIKDYSRVDVNNIILETNTTGTSGNTYYRQVADDFHLSCFISTPCIWIN